MLLIKKHKITVALFITLLVSVIPFCRYTQVSQAASSSYTGCYQELPSKTSNVTTLTSIPCPKNQTDTDGDTLQPSQYCYYVEQNQYQATPIYEKEPCATLLCAGGSADAQNVTCDPQDPCDPQNPDNTSTLCDSFVQDYVNPLILFLGSGVGIVIVIMVVIGGIEYITSGGDPKRTAEGRKRISNAIFALVIWILIFALLEWIVPGGLFH